MSPELRPDAMIANRYKLGVRLDAGGAAEVWSAEDHELKREVAVKILLTPPGAEASFLDRFREEAQLEAKLKHPGIVEVFDWGHDGDANYIVMEYLQGRTLRQILDTDGPIAPDHALSIARQTAAALAYAHQAGVAHGTISPAQVIVGPDGRATMIGFGLACREGMCDRPPMPDADTYSLGGVVYEMLTGASPFGAPPPSVPAGTPWPEPVDKLAPAVSSDFAHVVMRAVAADPAQRYVTAAQLQAALDELAKPKSHAALWAALAGLLLVLAIGGVWLYIARQTVAVPDVVGTTSAEASATLSASGFKMVVVGQQAVATLPPDAVVSQVPAGGSQARKGGQVQVVVNSGKPQVIIPSVVGTDLDTASTQISNAGLVVGTVTRKASDTIPNNAIISSDPAAGTQVVQGTKIDLVVSSGPSRVTMPDVRGSTQADATTKLTDLGLKVDVGTTFSNQPNGIVVSQSPSPGTGVISGSTVTISVSKGSAPVTVPDLTNTLATDAAGTLQSLGLVPVTTEESTTVTSEQGRVIDQSPNPGTQVAKGSQVTITVGVKP